MLYSLTKVTRVFGKRTVLDVDSLDIPAGRITALMGPNGAGKTTLLSILAFLDFPTKGDLYFGSNKVRFSESFVHPLRREVVLINQHPIMFSRTVYKNMEFGLKLRGIGKKKRNTIIEESLGLVGLEHFSQARAHKLSGGETQRVAIARALALSPKVILCDEPLASVDSQNQAVIVSLLKQINKKRGISIIFTSHDSVWAKNLAHEVRYLDEGKPVDSVLENIFSGIVEKDEAGQSLFVIGNGTVIPLLQAPLGQARISLDPSGMDLVPREHERSPGRIAGMIRQLSHEKNGVRVVVDMGLPCTILLSRERYQALDPKIGDNVSLHIPPHSISVLKS